MDALFKITLNLCVLTFDCLPLRMLQNLPDIHCVPLLTAALVEVVMAGREDTLATATVRRSKLSFAGMLCLRLF